MSSKPRTRTPTHNRSVASSHHNPLDSLYLKLPSSSYQNIKSAKKKSYLDIYHQHASTHRQQPTEIRMNYKELITPVKNTFLMYGNAVYQGSTIRDLEAPQKRLRHGQGILINNQGYVVVSYWKHSSLNGNAVVFTPNGARIYCEFLNDRLNGWAVYSLNNQVIVCQYFHLDKPGNQKLTFNSQTSIWVKSRFDERTQIHTPVQIQKTEFNQLPHLVQSEVLASKLEACFRHGLDFQFQYNIRHLKLGEGVSYLGFANQKTNTPSGLGILYANAQTYQGWFQKGGLHGYGRIRFKSGDLCQGYFEQGVYRGFGYEYSAQSNVSHISPYYKDTQASTERGGEKIYGIPRIDFLTREDILRPDFKYFEEQVRMSAGVFRLQQNIAQLSDIFRESSYSKSIVQTQVGGLAQLTNRSRSSYINRSKFGVLKCPSRTSFKENSPYCVKQSRSREQESSQMQDYNQDEADKRVLQPALAQKVSHNKGSNRQTGRMPADTSDQNDKSYTVNLIAADAPHTLEDNKQGRRRPDLGQFESLAINNRDSELLGKISPQKTHLKVSIDQAHDQTDHIRHMPHRSTNNLTHKMSKLAQEIPRQKKSRIFGKNNSLFQ